MTKYNIAEHFISINGEGPRAGTLSHFIRFFGCNLECSYCDTVWAGDAGKEGERMSAEEIHRMILTEGIRNVTLTGGEPLLQKDIGVLLGVLCSDPKISVEIETNGSVDISPFAAMKNRPVFTLDYKLPSSGMEIMMRVSNFDFLRSGDAVKFVAGSRSDLQRALTVIGANRLTERCEVHLSPVFGEIEPAEIVEFMKENRTNDVALHLQLHKLIWEPDRRGV